MRWRSSSEFGGTLGQAPLFVDLRADASSARLDKRPLLERPENDHGTGRKQSGTRFLPHDIVVRPGLREHLPVRLEQLHIVLDAVANLFECVRKRLLNFPVSALFVSRNRHFPTVGRDKRLLSSSPLLSRATFSLSDRPGRLLVREFT